MKYLKTYEKIYLKNIIPGRIYRISEFIIANKEYRTTMPIGRLLKCDDEKNTLTMKTFIKGTDEEHIFYPFFRKYIMNIASKEEILEFETIENTKKYNL